VFQFLTLSASLFLTGYLENSNFPRGSVEERRVERLLRRIWSLHVRDGVVYGPVGGFTSPFARGWPTIAGGKWPPTELLGNQRRRDPNRPMTRPRRKISNPRRIPRAKRMKGQQHHTRKKRTTNYLVWRKLRNTGCDRKLSAKVIFVIFFAIAWNFNAKIYTLITCSYPHNKPSSIWYYFLTTATL